MNTPTDPAMHQAVNTIVQTFETLSPQSVAQLGAIYAPDARFKDPFNEVQGLAQIQRIFHHMFATLENPRFHITGRIVQGGQCFLTWEFRFGWQRKRGGQAQCIVGGSHLVLDAGGRITLHRDYWDAAEELYEKLPLLGALMRWLKRRVNAVSAPSTGLPAIDLERGGGVAGVGEGEQFGTREQQRAGAGAAIGRSQQSQ